jgi:hypothetical protein
MTSDLKGRWETNSDILRKTPEYAVAVERERIRVELLERVGKVAAWNHLEGRFIVPSYKVEDIINEVCGEVKP